MRRLLLFSSVFVLFVSVACGLTPNFGFPTIEGSGKIVTENREVSGFTRVDVCCGMELYLTQGDSESLEIEADDNFMEEIITTVVGNRLEIKYQRTKNINYRPSQPVKLYLTMADVRGVSLSGGGYFEVETLESDGFDLDMSGGSDAWIATLTTGDINVDISGGGNLEAGFVEGDQVNMDFSGGSDAQIEKLSAASLDVETSGGGQFEADSCQVDHLNMSFSGSSDGEISSLTAETLELRVSGGGFLRISGAVTEQDINLSGGSSFKAGDLESKDATFSAGGGGDSTVWVTDNLSVDLSGGSSLGYYGRPQILDQSLSGGSDLDSLGERE
jgi:hypothetical protein